MKKVKSLRERRTEWFRSMFATCFAEWHEVCEVSKKSSIWEYSLLLWSPGPKKPSAKHADYKALETRLKAVEQRVCNHVFAAPEKACLASIVCSLCGAIDPAWEKVEPKRWDDNDEVASDWVPPQAWHDGVGYVPKKGKKK